jgi:hypothetical protein
VGRRDPVRDQTIYERCRDRGDDHDHDQQYQAPEQVIDDSVQLGSSVLSETRES